MILKKVNFNTIFSNKLIRFARMQLSKRHIFSALLLALMLCFKALPYHTVMHLVEGDDHIDIEHCTDCEYQLLINEVPLLYTQVAQIPENITITNFELTTGYITPLLVGRINFNFSNKAPPYFI